MIVIRAALRTQNRGYVYVDVIYGTMRGLQADEQAGFPHLINHARDSEMIAWLEAVDQVRYEILSDNAEAL